MQRRASATGAIVVCGPKIALSRAHAGHIIPVAVSGTTPRTVLTDVGALGLAVPRYRAGTFEPQIVRKGQARLPVP